MLRRTLLLLAVTFTGCQAGPSMGNFLAPAQVVVNPSTLQLTVGQEAIIRASANGQPAAFVWSSSDTAIITVSRTIRSDEARVRARKPGHATATATYESRGSSAVTVIP